VNAAPAWSTVLVCPGSYPEQVVISQPLILRGVLNGTAGAAIITVPAGGLSLNAPSLAFGGMVAAQLLVQNTAGVRVDHLIVDGSGSTCPAGANRTIGIEFYNVGDASWVNAAGFIANDVVRNEVDGCGLGAAIDSENSFITISNNEVHDFDREGIIQSGGSDLIAGNTIQGGGQYAIALLGGHNSRVDDNKMFSQNGILLDGGTSAVTVNANIMGPFLGTGILLNQVSTITITNNEIDTSYLGIVLNGSSGNTVQYNTLVHTAQFGIVDQHSGGGSLINYNTVNEAAVALLVAQSPGTTDVLVPNNFQNVTVTTSTIP